MKCVVYLSSCMVQEQSSVTSLTLTRIAHLSLSSPIYISSLVFSLTSRYSRKEIESYFALQRQQYPDGKLCDPMTQQELISSVLTPALEVQADLDRLYPRQTAGDTGGAGGARAT